jgi:hypothetical protein
MSVLGTPSSVYYKSEEINKLALNDNIQSLANQQNDYFYNYITLGLVSFVFISCLLFDF